MTDFLDSLIQLWREPVDRRPDPAGDFGRVYANRVTVNGAELTVDQLVARARALHVAYADVEIEPVHRIDAPGRVVVAFRLRARHVGPLETPLGTVAATGRRVENRVTDILTLTDGRVTEIWMTADDLGLLRQLDAVRLVD